MAKVKFITVKGSERLSRSPFYVGVVQHERIMSRRETYTYCAERTGYKPAAVRAVFLALAIRLMSAGWESMKGAMGRGLDRLFAALRQTLSKLPETLSGAEIANGLDLFVCMLVIPPIAAALTFLLVRYGIALPFTFTNLSES